MLDGPRLRPSVLLAREQLAQGRSKLKIQHQSGSPGVQVCARLTDLLDTIVLDLYTAALDEIDDHELTKHIALVAHGGYGRRDVAPFSDVDLMVVYEKSVSSRMKRFLSTLSQQIVDSGLTLGFSSRTPSEAVSMAINDATIFTSLYGIGPQHS